MVINPPQNSFHWDPSWLLVPSRLQPTGLFDRVTDSSGLNEVIAIESLTNARLRHEWLTPQNERRSTSRGDANFASFSHTCMNGSRFSNGDYGLYYAAKTIETALAEARYHRECFLRRTNEPPINIGMQTYASVISTLLHDIRGMQTELPNVYDKNSYADSQRLALDLRATGSNGLVFDSVRHAGGECAGIFRANIPQPVVHSGYYCFQWDGQSISNTYQKST